MARLVIGTVDVDGERFPQTYIEIDGKRWLVKQTGSVASALEQHGRFAVSNKQLSPTEFEVTPL